MTASHLILCCPLLLLPSIFPSIRVFSNELALGIRWPKYWSFSFSIIGASNEYSGLISFRCTAPLLNSCSKRHASPSFLQSSLTHGYSPVFLSLCELMEWYYWQAIQIVLLIEFGARIKTNKNPQSVEFATLRIIKIPQLERSIVPTKHIPCFYSGFSLLLGWHPSQPVFPDYSNIYCFSSSLQHSLCPHHWGHFRPPSGPPQHPPSPSRSSCWLRAYSLLCITFLLPKSVFPTKVLAKAYSFCCPISQHGAWHRLGAQSIFIVGIVPPVITWWQQEIFIFLNLGKTEPD